MEKELDRLYNELVNHIVSMIPTGWKKIFFLGEVEKNKSTYNITFYFVDDNNFIQRAFDIPDKYNVSEEIFDDLLIEANDIMIKLYDCFIKNNQKNWVQMYWNISEEGKFSVEFSYNENIFKEMIPSLREIVWAYTKFNYIPKDKCSKELLNEYISKN